LVYESKEVLQRMEVKMNEWMELLRGPVLGIVMVILFLASGLILAAFAALVAQMGLFLRSTSKQSLQEKGTAAVDRGHWQTSPAEHETGWDSEMIRYPSSSGAQMGIAEQHAADGVDIGW
jgi:hypothetical protein